ncbi:hypothetical protein FA13DRAFT_1712362 [Coprinellus micaceus]|uniref:Uncharacterized protein n=1 Tax=Coprinellus micaceus TaxID=71717 RepID=A0A4Y7T0H0_COPMI|nr:hypothetical protein FA13DRAFT_1712362 [Coprinellus micaceus]
MVAIQYSIFRPDRRWWRGQWGSAVGIPSEIVQRPAVSTYVMGTTGNERLYVNGFRSTLPVLNICKTVERRARFEFRASDPIHPIQEGSKASGGFQISKVRFGSRRVRAQSRPEFKKQLRKRANSRVDWAISISVIWTRAPADGSHRFHAHPHGLNPELCQCWREFRIDTTSRVDQLPGDCCNRTPLVPRVASIYPTILLGHGDVQINIYWLVGLYHRILGPDPRRLSQWQDAIGPSKFGAWYQWLRITVDYVVLLHWHSVFIYQRDPGAMQWDDCRSHSPNVHLDAHGSTNVMSEASEPDVAGSS